MIYILFLIFLIYLSIKDIKSDFFSFVDLLVLSFFLLIITKINLLFIFLILVFIFIETLYRNSSKNFFNIGLPDFYILIIFFILSTETSLKVLSLSVNSFIILISINSTLAILLYFFTKKNIIKKSKKKYYLAFLPLILPFFLINLSFYYFLDSCKMQQF